MNILLSCLRTDKGGAEKYWVNVYPYLEREAKVQNCYILALEDSFLHKSCIKKKMNVITLPYFKKVDKKLSLMLSNILREYNINIIHSSNSQEKYLIPAAIKRLDNKAIKYFLTESIGIHKYHSLTHKRYFKYLTNYFVLSEHDAEVAKIKIPISKNKIKVLPNGIDLEKYKLGKIKSDLKIKLRNEIEASSTNPYIFICVARINEGKGFWEFLNASKALVDKYDDVYTVWIGWFEEGREYLKEALDTLDAKYKQKIKFLGYRDNILEYLGGSDCFVMISAYEAFGLTYIEAMAAGLPLIGANTRGSASIIEGCNAGLTVPPKNTKSLLKAMEYYYLNKEESKNMGLSNLEKVKKYDMSLHIKKLIEYYQ